MKILIIILLLSALAAMVLSVVFTVGLFREFGSGKSAEERTSAIKKLRNKMIGCYAAAALFITAAAAVKLTLVK